MHGAISAVPAEVDECLLRNGHVFHAETGVDPLQATDPQLNADASLERIDSIPWVRAASAFLGASVSLLNSASSQEASLAARWILEDLPIVQEGDESHGMRGARLHSPGSECRLGATMGSKAFPADAPARSRQGNASSGSISSGRGTRGS